MAQEKPLARSLLQDLQDTLDRDLEDALRRELPSLHVASNYRLQRLQPVAVPPPPALTSKAVEQGQYASALEQPASPEDDLEVESEEKNHAFTLITASVVLLAGAGLIGAFMYFLSAPAPAVMDVPEIKALPESRTVVVPYQPVAPAPTLQTIAPPIITAPETATVQPTPQSSASVSMGDVSSDLIAPTTDGLSPARRIGTIRIQLDGDREISPQR